MITDFTEGAWFPMSLFAGMLAMLVLGRLYGRRQLRLHGEDHASGTGAIEAAVFALLGLLVAFTFSGAAARFDARRAQIIDEANNIGTAYLRIDLLAADKQPALRAKFREYTDARLAVYRHVNVRDGVKERLAHASSLQNEIWALAVPAAQEAGAPAVQLLIPALNAMFDITTVRTWAKETHPPLLIFVLLSTLALAAALIAGHGLAGATSRNSLHLISFALVLSATVFVIVDLEYPRLGFLRIDNFDQAIADVRAGMK
jgi:hypothetical protein